MTISIDARSHHGLPAGEFNSSPTTWTHNGGTPAGVLALVLGEATPAALAAHPDEVVSVEYGCRTLNEVSGSPYVSTDNPGFPHLDANGNSWHGHTWTVHAFFLGQDLEPGDQDVVVTLNAAFTFQLYQVVVWTYNANPANDLYTEALAHSEARTATPAVSFTTTHTAFLAGAVGTDAAGVTGIAVTVGTQTYEEDYGIVAGAWAESSGPVAAGGQSFAWHQFDPNFGSPPGLDLIMPSLAAGIGVYEGAKLTPLPPCGAAYWGVLASAMT